MALPKQRRDMGYFDVTGAASNLSDCFVVIWGWVKTLVPSEPQNSWDFMDVRPTKNVSIGIDPYPYFMCRLFHGDISWGYCT